MRTSRLPHGAHFDGRIRGQGDLIIAGEVDGPIEIDGQLTIEATGVVRGDIRARSIAIAGHVEGNASALELIRLEPGAKMIGDARAERVSAGTGALLRGRIRTSTERAQNERMRRTSGGTLLAPFSSSGSIAAPTFSSREAPTFLDAAPRTSTLAGYAAPEVEPPTLSFQRPEPTPAPRVEEVAVSEAAKVPEALVAKVDAPPSRSSVTPPRPVMPVIARQKAVRRPEGSA
jgi:cytoskeletal protein CcmA (bactofilin family)